MGTIRMMFDYESTVLTVPALFIDHYMTACPSVYVLIYLYSLRRAGAGEAASATEIAAHFNILETDVHNAWRHWEAAGVVSVKETAGEMTVAFLPPEAWRKITHGTHATDSPPIVALPSPVAHKNTVPFNERPLYNAQELTLFREKSKEVAHLFTRAEQTLGKLLTYHDMNVLFGFYDWLRLPVDVLDFLLLYCAEKDHRDLRYIEKCALDWADNGINNVEKARQYVQNFDNDYRAVLQAMGSNAGSPTPTQRKYIDKWREQWNMPTALILEACDRAGVQIGKPKFTYVDKIITAWHTAGIHTPEGVKTADEEFMKTREITITPMKTTRAKSNRFANFTQRKNDHAHLEKLQREYVLREMKG